MPKLYYSNFYHIFKHDFFYITLIRKLCGMLLCKVLYVLHIEFSVADIIYDPWPCNLSTVSLYFSCCV